MRKRTILLDCDGILSDFVSPALELVYNHTGDRHYVSEIVQWDVFAAIGKKQHEHILDKAVKESAFCSNLPVMFGAQEAVESLRQLGEVYIVTSPYHAPSWVYERTLWLEKHFGFTRKQIVNTPAKHLVMGDVLVDDSEKNLKDWKETNPDGLAILWDSPWNRHVDHVGVRRLYDWDSVVETIKAHVEK